MQVGKWLDNQGIDAKPCVRASAAPALPAVPTQKAVERLLAAVYAPWNDIDNGKHKPVKVCTNPPQLLLASLSNRLSDLSLFLEACSHDLQDTVMYGHCTIACVAEPAKRPIGAGAGGGP